MPTSTIKLLPSSEWSSPSKPKSYTSTPYHSRKSQSPVLFIESGCPIHEDDSFLSALPRLPPKPTVQTDLQEIEEAELVIDIKGPKPLQKRKIDWSKLHEESFYHKVCLLGASAKQERDHYINLKNKPRWTSVACAPMRRQTKNVELRNKPAIKKRKIERKQPSRKFDQTREPVTLFPPAPLRVSSRIRLAHPQEPSPETTPTSNMPDVIMLPSPSITTITVAASNTKTKVESLLLSTTSTVMRTKRQAISRYSPYGTRFAARMPDGKVIVSHRAGDLSGRVKMGVKKADIDCIPHIGEIEQMSAALQFIESRTTSDLKAADVWSYLQDIQMGTDYRSEDGAALRKKNAGCFLKRAQEYGRDLAEHCNNY